MRSRLFVSLALALLGALAGAQQTMPEGLYVGEGTATGGSLRSLYAFDANALSVAFHVPADAPSAILHAETGTAPDGGTVQAYLYSPSAGGLALGAQTPSNGVVEFALTGAQLAQYRDASGALNVQLRAVRPSGAFTWSVERLVVLTPILSSFVYDNEGGHASGTLASLRAVDGDLYTLTTAAEASGNGNVSASFSVGYRVPAGTPSATLRAVTGLAGGGGNVQAFTYYAAVGGTELWDAATPSGQNTVDVPITSSQIATYRDASGVLNMQFRVYAPASSVPAGTAWNTDQLVLWAAPNNGPALPTGLAASPVSSSRIDLIWTDNANNETGYVVERKGGADADFVQVGTANADSTVYHDSGLTSSTAYTYRVRATNGNGDSPNSNEANATTNASPAPRLASLALDRHNTLGSNRAITATVSLTSAATSPTTVRLYCNDADVTVPSSVVVPAGQSSASVGVSYSSAPYPLTRAATVSAYLGNWAQKDQLEVLDNQTSLAFKRFTATAGDGLVALAWDPMPRLTYSLVKIERRTIDPSTGQVVGTAQFNSRGPSYYDFSALNGSTYDYRVTVDPEGDEVPPAPSAWVRVQPQTSGVSFSWQAPPPQSGAAQISAGLSSSTTQGALLVVDGQKQGGSGDGADSAPRSSVGLLFDPIELSAGNRGVRLVASVNGTLVATPESTVSVSSSTFGLHAQSVFEWGIGELDGVNLHLSSKAFSWQIDVVDGSNQTVRSWSGDDAQPVGFAWDGSDTSLQNGTDGTYTVRATVTTTSGKLSASSSVSSVYKPPTALFLLNYVTRDYNVRDEEYAARLEAMCQRIHSNYTAFRGRVLLRKTIDADTEDALRRWMGSSVDTFYLQGHGGGPNSNNGEQQFSVWAGTVFTPSQPLSQSTLIGYGLQGAQFIVNQVTKGRSYKFAWMDTCNSGGGVGLPSGAVGISNMNFHQAFGTLAYDGRVTVTWNGFDTLNFNETTGDRTGWWYWRDYLWVLLEQGNTFDEALQNRTLISQLDRGPTYGRSPYDTRSGNDPNYPYGIVPRINYSRTGGTLLP